MIKRNLDKIYKQTIKNINPIRLIESNIKLINNNLHIKKKVVNLNSINDIYIISFGKGSVNMALGLKKILKKKIKNGIIVTNQNINKKISKFDIIQSSHPIPTQQSINATNKIIKILKHSKENDLIIFLISGGGSSLIAKPENNITLKEKKIINNILLKSGLKISDINDIRKLISSIKGGKLLKHTYPSYVCNIIISDVVNGKAEDISSGPTTYKKNNYNIKNLKIFKKRLSKNVIKKISAIKKFNIKDYDTSKFENHIIADNKFALEKAKEASLKLGYEVIMYSVNLEGEARKVAASLAKYIKNVKPKLKPICIILGGETHVTVEGNGKGGRNTEFALAFSIEIMKSKKISALFAGTDGVDGKTDAAGAYCDEKTIINGLKKGMDANKYLKSNNSYNFFKKLNLLKKTGPTGANMNDIGLIIVDI